MMVDEAHRLKNDESALYKVSHERWAGLCTPPCWGGEALPQRRGALRQPCHATLHSAGGRFH